MESKRIEKIAEVIKNTLKTYDFKKEGIDSVSGIQVPAEKIEQDDNGATYTFMATCQASKNYTQEKCIKTRPYTINGSVKVTEGDNDTPLIEFIQVKSIKPQG